MTALNLASDNKPNDPIDLVENHLPADVENNCMDRIVPKRPSLVLIGADVGAGKTSLLCGIAAAKTRESKRVLYIYGEGHPSDYEAALKAAGADMSLVTLIDCVVEHSTVQLDSMLDHAAIKPHSADCIIVDPLAPFESTSIRNHKIRQRLAPFHTLVRKGASVFIALHTNSERSVKKPLYLIPRGWAGNAEIVWQLYATDKNGHAVLEMTRGRHYPQPWDAWDFWLARDESGAPVAVIDKPAEKRIADLLLEKNPNYLPRSVREALDWLRKYLKDGARHRNECYADGKEAGHSEPGLMKAKQAGKIDDRKREGDGLSEWYLPAAVSVGSVDGHEPEQLSQVSRARDQTPTLIQVKGDAMPAPETAAVEGKKVRRVRVSLSEAHAFTDLHHRHLDAARSNARFAVGLRSETGALLAVIIVGRPCDPKTDQNAVVELSRVVTKGNRDDPNAASILIAAAVRFAVALACERVQTFTLPHELGTTYEACGFVEKGSTKPSGRGDDPYPTKTRWEKVLPEQWHKLKKASRKGVEGLAA